jgi:glycerophosphoryl diester phosphodiesterase
VAASRTRPFPKGGSNMTTPQRVCLLLVFLGTARAPARAAEPRPRVVGHRGLLRHAPENTLANFRACLELRLGFEFDVQATRDGQLVCIHDSALDRTTNGKGQVAERTLAEIRAIDAGTWFDPGFAGEKVPTVEEVLRLVADHRESNILIAVDLKADHVAHDVVRLAEKHGVLHRLLFIGSAIADPSVRQEIHQASASAHTAALAGSAEEFSRALAAADADWVYLRFLPSRAQVEAVHRAGKRAFLAGPTVAGHVPENWRRAAGADVDAILTDYPLEMRAALR